MRQEAGREEGELRSQELQELQNALGGSRLAYLRFDSASDS
jgi:hypothetical protein